MHRIGRIVLSVATVASLALAVALTAVWWSTEDRTIARHIVIPLGERTLWLLATSHGFRATLYLSRPPLVVRREEDVLPRRKRPRTDEGRVARSHYPSNISTADVWLRRPAAGRDEGRLAADTDGKPAWTGGAIPEGTLNNLAYFPVPLTDLVASRWASAPAGFVIGPLLLLPTAYVGALVAAFFWRSRRLRAGRCRACGYDLRATPDRCPECGVAPAR